MSDSTVYQRIAEIQIELMEMKIPKTGYNRFNKHKYHELEDLIPPILKECFKRELMLDFTFTSDEAILKVRDWNTPADMASTRLPMPKISELNGGMNVAQSEGAFITYFKRYLLTNMFLIMEKDVIDADGEEPEEKKESLRKASSKVLNSLANSSKLIFGGAADLSSSTLTYLTDKGDFSHDDYNGRNIFFGVREAAMAGIANGLALSGYRPFVSTYLTFSDYLKPALRLSCLMNLPVTYIFTHDSITVGEDGPTHQAVEQLVSLRATPNLEVFRPSDSNEVIGTYKTIFENNKPACIILGRNETIVRETSSVPLVSKGAYIIKHEERKLDGIIIATGEEIDLAFDIVNVLFEKGYDFRIISMPSIERYNKLSDLEKEELLPIGKKKFIVEKSSAYSWYKFAYNDNYLFTVDRFGLSGKASDINAKFNFTSDEIALKIEEIIK